MKMKDVSPSDESSQIKQVSRTNVSRYRPTSCSPSSISTSLTNTPCPTQLYQISEAFADIKLYLFFFIGFISDVPNSGISNFGTLIIKGFSFSTLHTTLLQIPYGIFVIISILSCVLINNHLTNKRCLLALLYLLPNIAGSIGLITIAKHHHVARYICYLLTAPYVASAVMVLSMQIANTAGHTKKVVTTAALFLGYCAGNACGPFFYKASQAPDYTLGFWSMIVSYILEAAAIAILWVVCYRKNVRRDYVQSQLPGGLEGRDLDSTAFGDLTDGENLNFRYVY